MAINERSGPRWLPVLKGIHKSPEQLAAIKLKVTSPDWKPVRAVVIPTDVTIVLTVDPVRKPTFQYKRVGSRVFE